MDLELRSVANDEELHLANDLMAKVHGMPYFDAMNWLETCGATYPGFQREHTRVAMSNGELAASLRITTETIRLGEARLKTGCFGWVTTSTRFRHKGICRSLMIDALHYMRNHGYHVSMLFGIPNFYHRFGFTTVLANHSIRLEVSEAATAAQSVIRHRPGKPGDLNAIQKIHNGNDVDVACSILRSAAHMTNRWDRLKTLQVLTNENGKVTGYVLPRTTKDHLAVDEVGVTDEASCQDVLSYCAKVAKDEAVGTIHFMVPPPHPFARYLLQFRSSHEMQIVREEGGMMAFVNLGETLEHLISEWESRLTSARAREYRTEITLLVDKAPYLLRANRGAIDVSSGAGKNKVSLSGADLMHLMTGYRYVDDVLGKTRRMLTPEARELLAVIFPKRTPYVWMYDRF